MTIPREQGYGDPVKRWGTAGLTHDARSNQIRSIREQGNTR
jgi:hypothetical protein